MAEYEKIVRDILKKHGCYFVRHGKGDHDIWYSPLTDTNFTVDGKLKYYRLKSVGCFMTESHNLG